MIISKINNAGAGKRLAYFDALKCLGILLVINGHVQLFGMDIKAYDSVSNLMFYSFNMPLFFFVSGYLAFKENTIGKISEIKKVGNKVVSLVVPAIVFYCYSNFQEHGGGVFDFLSKGFGKYWFTFTLFEMFLIYYVVSWISRSKRMFVAILLMLSVIGVGYLSFFSQYEIFFFDFNHLSKYFQFFTIGVLAKMFAEQYDNFLRSEYLKAFAIVAFFGILFSLFKIEMPSIIFHFLRDIILRYLGLFLVLSFFYCNQDVFNGDTPLNKLILKIGQNSLAIYLLQYFFMPDFSAFPIWLEGMDMLSSYAVSFVYTIYITALCMVFVKLLKNSMLLRKYLLGGK